VRRYSGEDVKRLKFIRSAQAAGFTLAEIGELIALDASDDRARVRELANARVAAIDEKIAELRDARDALAGLATACASKRGGPCPILKAFDPK
jgi:MerR family mercuric resistance operon transcriptional regulator